MRYVVIPGSDSGHCCFEATVEDRETVVWVSPSDPSKIEYKTVAECFFEDDANLVAKALNQKDHLDRIVANAKRAIRAIESINMRRRL